VWSTAVNDRPNGPHDVDITLYSLKKWAGLACKGNPTALHFLCAESVMSSSIWKQIAGEREIFLSRTFVKPFLGFADDQPKRMTGKKGRGKKGQRPEIERKYGYDVKAAMHTLRLLYECKELMLEHGITLPRPERDFLIKVRTGKYSMEKVLAAAEELFAECEEAATASALPEKIDRKSVSRLVTAAYRAMWDAM
jgi:uncharacterized protein